MRPLTPRERWLLVAAAVAGLTAFVSWGEAMVEKARRAKEIEQEVTKLSARVGPALEQSSPHALGQVVATLTGDGVTSRREGARMRLEWMADGPTTWGRLAALGRTDGRILHASLRTEGGLLRVEMTVEQR